MGEKAVLQLVALFSSTFATRNSSIIDVELVIRHSTSKNNKI